MLSRRHLIITSAVALTLISSTIALVLFFRAKPSDPQVLSVQAPAPSPPPVEQTSDLTTLNILLLGYGGAGHQGGFLTDAILVAHLNFKTQTFALISIPRDLWIAYPDGNNRKINSAWSYGAKAAEESKKHLDQDEALSGSSTVKSLATTITGLPINYFVAIDFVGFQRAIGEVLDGISVNVPEPLSDPWYPIQGEELNTCGLTAEEVSELTQKYSGFDLQKQFPCRYEHLQINKGPTAFEGGDALKYVRSRHSGSDFERSQRQMAVILGFRDKLIKVNALDDAIKFFKSFLYTIKTDLDESAVAYLAPALKNTGNYQEVFINLDTTNVFQETKSSSGQFILLPKSDWKEIHDYIKIKLSKGGD